MTDIETLQKAGLTEYEAKIYSALLILGPSKASEVNKKSGVPKNKVYEILDVMAKKGLVKVIPKTPKKYFVKGIDSLKILLNKKEEEISLVKKELLDIEKRSSKESINIKEIVWIADGHEAFVSKIKEVMGNVKKENLILARKLRADPVTVRLTEQAIKRGAIIKMILPNSIDKTKIQEWKDIGVKIRYLESSPEITFSIFDDNLCRLNLSIRDNLADPTLWIESAAFIQILKERFNNLWKEAKN